MQTKHCPKCDESKSLTEFSKDSHSKGGLRCQCRSCCKKYRDLYYSNSVNRARRVKQVLESRNRKGLDFYKKYQREMSLQRYFGLTVEQYDTMFEQQKGVCAVCGHPQTEKRLAVDHNHITGEIRGLLCTNCNVKLGWYEKQKENLKVYLRE